MGPGKRKEGPEGNQEGRALKKSKGGSGGKWQTPNHKAKVEAFRGKGSIEPGDVGIWGTCARNQEGRATIEMRSLLYQFAEKFYGIAPEAGDEDEDVVDDIEASIRNEVALLSEGMNAKPRLFSPVRLNIECVLFFKVQPPIEPVEFVRRICKEVAADPATKLTRYLNRLTPMTLIGKATEKGLEDVGATVLGAHFKLNSEPRINEAQENGESQKGVEGVSYPSYAIRPTIRNHTTLKRDAVIKSIASSIADIHKVNLTKPDKVILVEIYQTMCGMSVVGSDWESLKRYNLTELYQAKPAAGTQIQADVAQKGRIKEEVSAAPGLATRSVGPN
ncbi:THUMP domain-containing protein [Tricladium varicosporioides]|nr:THUMP domain-containing protein [Hymenoscyphus varicosporioides]